MSRQVFCSKLNQEAEGLDSPPLPGAAGEKIFNHISKQAWKMWLSQQTMLINEYRLSLADPESRKYLLNEMDNFLFKGGCAKPAGFTPQSPVEKND